MRSKKVPRAVGKHCAQAGRRCRRHGNLVRRRGSHRPEEQDHPPLGQTRQPSFSALGSAHRVDLHLRRNLSQRGQGRGAGSALVQHGDDEPASCGDLRRCRTRTPCGIAARSGWWHLSGKLAVPDNITIVPLPPKCPELNAQENVWQFMRDNWLSNRVFDSIDTLLDHCCDAWNKLEAQPWTVMSLGLRDWAYGS